MISMLKGHHGMNIVGQGGKIILFMLPSLVAATLVHVYFPSIAALPEGLGFLRPVGYVVLLVGLVFWGTAILQLMVGFSQSKLVTTGAYGIVRNPIYSSAALFLLPGVTLITMTWVYLVASVFIYMGVMIFIGKEEGHLKEVFGKQYEDYMAAVDRLIPFKRP